MQNEPSKEYLIQEYVKKGRSTYEIADDCHTYPNKIRRLLKKYRIDCRNKSEAQSVAIKTGRHKHPTKGSRRPEEIKIKIGEGVAKAWKELTDSDKQRRVIQAKQQWDSMSEEQKALFKKLAAEAIRKSAREGSKLERFLLTELKRAQYNVLFHKNNLVSNEELHIDLFLPNLRVAIEVDGPSHFFPIWGEENLAKHLATDYQKTGLLLSAGYVLIRIKNLAKNMSKIQYRQLLTTLLSQLKCVETSFPKESERLIEIELK